jgi:uncharacterized protein (DUF2384 family)
MVCGNMLTEKPMKIVIPYSLYELFNPKAAARADFMRAEAIKVFGKKNMAEFVCSPNRYLDGKTPLALATKSVEGHRKVMTYLGQIKYGVYI